MEMEERSEQQQCLSDNQYGGVKGCSTDHFLLETWDTIISALEHPDSAVNLISIDFEKAFNRMDHEECLIALADMGAEMEAIDWVAAFLYGRNMKVKIDNEFSTPRSVPGGSPQGSILGNFLFCCTTNQFANLGNKADFSSYVSTSEEEEVSSESSISEPRMAANTSSELALPGLTVSTPSARGQFARFAPPISLADNLDDEYTSDEESFQFWRARNNALDSTLEESQMEELEIPDCRCIDPLKCLVYICLLYTSPSPRDLSTSRMPSSA